MSHVKKLIRGCDQFGVLSQITYFNNDVKFQTLYGGILSLLLYFLGFSYLLYMLIIWQTYQIPPFYMSQPSFNPDIKFTLTQPLFVFGLVIGNLGNVTTNDRMVSISKKGVYYDQFTWDEQLELMTPNDPGYPCVVTNNESYLFDPVCVNLQDKNQTYLEKNYYNPDQTYDTFYSIYGCVQDYETEPCLKYKDRLDLNRNTRWKLTLFTQDVDIKTGEIKNIAQNLQFWNDEINQTLLFTLNIKKATFIIDRGIIFSDEQVIEVVRSIELVKNFQGNYSTKIGAFDTHAFAQIGYSLDGQEEIIRVTYPKLGAILSQVFSIFQLLLLSGLIMNMFNKRIMNYNIEQALLQVYFPQIKLFKFDSDWRGRIKSIFFRDKILLNEDFKRVKQFRDNRANQLRGKLNSINMIYEISRIQMHLQSKIPIQEYYKIQGLGYKMNLPKNLTEQILLDDQNQLIDYYDLNVDNQKHKAHQTEEILYVEDNPKIQISPNHRSIIDLPTVTKKNKQQLNQVHSLTKDMNRVQPKQVLLIEDHQINLPPNRSVNQIATVTQKIQIIPIHEVTVTKDKIQDLNAVIPEDNPHQNIDQKELIIL